MSIVISDQPYANWLAESLGYLERQNIRKLVLAGIDETNHEVVTGYFECTVSDKAGVAAAIQADALSTYWAALKVSEGERKPIK